MSAPPREALDKPDHLGRGVDVQARIGAHLRDLDTGGIEDGAIGSGDPLGLLPHLRDKRYGIIRGEVADLEGDLGTVGHDIERLAARDLAHVQGRIGNVVIRIARPRRSEVDLQGPQGENEIRRKVNGIDEIRRHRRMPRLPVADRLQRHLALVTEGQLHLGRLAHDHGAGLADHEQDRRQHIAQTEAANFFIVGKHDLQRFFQLRIARPLRQRQRTRDKALHVGGTTAIGATLVDAQLEGIAGPDLPFHRHNICMPRKGYSPPRWPDLGIEPRLLPRGIKEPLHPRTCALQKPLGIIHQRKV